MTESLPSATPYPDVNAALSATLAGIQATLGDQLIGVYLHGSLANGDFNPLTSDIDLMAATRDELPARLLPELASMHAQLAGRFKWAGHMEVSYIPLAALRRYDPANCQHPALRVDGSFGIDGHGSDWIIQRWVIREKGIALAGPPAAALIDPVQPDDLRRAASGILREWWAPMLNDTSRLQDSEYQAYAILTMCRSLYTLEHGRVVSKPTAARWAQAALGEPDAALIDRALNWRPGVELDALPRTLDLIRRTLRRASRRAGVHYAHANTQPTSPECAGG